MRRNIFFVNKSSFEGLMLDKIPHGRSRPETEAVLLSILSQLASKNQMPERNALECA